MTPATFWLTLTGVVVAGFFGGAYAAEVRWARRLVEGVGNVLAVVAVLGLIIGGGFVTLYAVVRVVRLAWGSP